MYRRFRQMLAARRRRRALVKIRGEFARCGYPLHGLSDAEIEASLPPGTCDAPPDYLGAKTVSRAVRRLRVSGGPRPALKPKGGDVVDTRRAVTPLRKVR